MGEGIFFPRSLVSLCLITKSLTGVALIEGLFCVGAHSQGSRPGLCCVALSDPM